MVNLLRVAEFLCGLRNAAVFCIIPVSPFFDGFCRASSPELASWNVAPFSAPEIAVRADPV